MAVKGLSEEGDTTLSLEKHSSESPKNFGVCVLTDGSQNDTLPHTLDGCEKRRRTQGQDLDVMFTFSG